MRLVDFITASERGTEFIVYSPSISRDGQIRFTRESLLNYDEVYAIVSDSIKSFVSLNYKLVAVFM